MNSSKSMLLNFINNVPVQKVSAERRSTRRISTNMNVENDKTAKRGMKRERSIVQDRETVKKRSIKRGSIGIGLVVENDYLISI